MATIVGAGLFLAGVNGLVAVAMGSVGAHVVSQPSSADWIATGSTFQLAHAALLAALSAVAASDPTASGLRIASARGDRWTLALLGATIILTGFGAAAFSGALYCLALFDSGRAVAPWGGGAMMAGWLALTILGLRLVAGQRQSLTPRR